VPFLLGTIAPLHAGGLGQGCDVRYPVNQAAVCRRRLLQSWNSVTHRMSSPSPAATRNSFSTGSQKETGNHLNKMHSKPGGVVDLRVWRFVALSSRFCNTCEDDERWSRPIRRPKDRGTCVTIRGGSGSCGPVNDDREPRELHQTGCDGGHESPGRGPAAA